MVVGDNVIPDLIGDPFLSGYSRGWQTPSSAAFPWLADALVCCIPVAGRRPRLLHIELVFRRDTTCCVPYIKKMVIRKLYFPT